MNHKLFNFLLNLHSTLMTTTCSHPRRWSWCFSWMPLSMCPVSPACCASRGVTPCWWGWEALASSLSPGGWLGKPYTCIGITCRLSHLLSVFISSGNRLQNKLEGHGVTANWKSTCCYLSAGCPPTSTAISASRLSWAEAMIMQHSMRISRSCMTWQGCKTSTQSSCSRTHRWVTVTLLL